ncbi:MAG: hypothetical protein ACKOAN_01500 [Chakrabartia sp.]
MLRKLLIALLTFCLATPAIALPACHAVPTHTAQIVQAAPMVHGGDHHMPAKAPNEDPLDQLRLAHGCLGCAAPMGVADALAPVMSGQARAWRAPVAPLSALDQRPDTPPPRA